MAKSKGPSKTEWHKAYECLAPIDAGQMRLVGAQRARQAISQALQRIWVFDYIAPLVWVVG